MFHAQPALLRCQCRSGTGGRNHLVEPAPADRVVPPLALEPVALVARPGRGILAQGIATIEPPEPGVRLHPVWRWRLGPRLEQTLVPGVLLLRSDAQPVAAGIVDERNAQALCLPLRRLGPLPEPCPHAPQPDTEARETLRIRYDDRRHVFAAEHIVRMRPRARIDDWMLPDSPQIWIVPAAPQVVAVALVL